MARPSCLAALGLASFALAPLAARANPTSVTAISPLDPPVDTSPLPTTTYWANPYWAKPYWANRAAPGINIIYSPGSPNLPPQLTSPAANPYPVGAQTCVARP